MIGYVDGVNKIIKYTNAAPLQYVNVGNIGPGQFSGTSNYNAIFSFTTSQILNNGTS